METVNCEPRKFNSRFRLFLKILVLWNFNMNKRSGLHTLKSLLQSTQVCSNTRKLRFGQTFLYPFLTTFGLKKLSIVWEFWLTNWNQLWKSYNDLVVLKTIVDIVMPGQYLTFELNFQKEFTLWRLKKLLKLFSGKVCRLILHVIK